MIGKTLGHYKITNQLGKGGMGEVFQDKDQVLGGMSLSKYCQKSSFGI